MNKDPSEFRSVQSRRTQWLMFIPAGIAISVVVQFAGRLPFVLLLENSAWAELVASLLEFPAFAVGALLVLPRIQKPILVVLGIVYIAFRFRLGIVNYGLHGNFIVDVAYNGAAIVTAAGVIWMLARSDGAAIVYIEGLTNRRTDHNRVEPIRKPLAEIEPDKSHLLQFAKFILVLSVGLVGMVFIHAVAAVIGCAVSWSYLPLFIVFGGVFTCGSMFFPITFMPSAYQRAGNIVLLAVFVFAEALYLLYVLPGAPAIEVVTRLWIDFSIVVTGTSCLTYDMPYFPLSMLWSGSDHTGTSGRTADLNSPGASEKSGD